MKIITLLFLTIICSRTLLAQTFEIPKIGNKLICNVNGLNLNFIFDTGADDITLSLTEALFMLKNGYLEQYDILDVSNAKLADGSIIENTEVLLRKVIIGKIELENIKATIINNSQAPLLLGQSAIKKLGNIELKGTKVIISPKKNNEANGKFYNLNAIYLIGEDNKYICKSIYDKNGRYVGVSNDKATIQEYIKNYHNSYFEFDDIDEDGKAELIITQNGGTSGNFKYIFSEIDSKTFKQIGQLEFCRDEIVISKGKIERIGFEGLTRWGEFNYNSNGLKNMPNDIPIIIKYKIVESKMVKLIQNNSFNSEIMENLNFLLNKQIEEKIISNDIKVELAHQLYCNFLYNNYNLEITQKLFAKFYIGVDSELFWEEIKDILKYRKIHNI